MGESAKTKEPGGLDFSVLEEATGGDRDLMRELAALYLSDADLQIRAIEDAVVSRDLDRVRRIAHNLVVASENVGAPAAAEAFRALEESAREGRPEEVQGAVTRGQDEFEKVKRSVAELR